MSPSTARLSATCVRVRAACSLIAAASSSYFDLKWRYRPPAPGDSPEAASISATDVAE